MRVVAHVVTPAEADDGHQLGLAWATRDITDDLPDGAPAEIARILSDLDR